MAFFKKGEVSFKDSSFIYIEWEKNNSPDTNAELAELIEMLDDTAPDEHLADNLPYLTFDQADKLFRTLGTAFQTFQIHTYSLAHFDDKGYPSHEGEPAVSPFLVTENFDNLLTPLMEECLRDERFAPYSYDELSLYFVNQIFDPYKKSLEIAFNQLPLFPNPNEVEGALERTNAPTEHRQVVESEEGDLPSSTVKKLTAGIVIAGVVGVAGLGYGLIQQKTIKLQTEQINYLHDELTTTQTVQNSEHEVDVFGRYFLSSYFSGDKDSLKVFLSDGDAKYTQPENATILSSLLESVDYADKQYTLTYVLSLKEDGSDTAESKRLTFKIKKSSKADYGYLVTQEPQMSNYVTPTSSSGD
ncbi:hypothetical protein [Streptococcus dentiloxodontae]